MDDLLGREHPRARAGAVSAGRLALAGITRRFASQLAVDDVSLAVGAGELLALVGASGSGKTTTLRIAAGYEKPDAGAVTLTGADGIARDITGIPPQQRGFGMVFQHYALFPHLTVEENVAFGLEARRVSRTDRTARARAALESVGLGGAGLRPVQSLSGGEQQRVAVARAVVIEPRVLLLDEPLSNLDPTLRRSMRDELRATLRRLNLTALLVTHDQEDAFAIADRVALMKQGRLLQTGTPQDLYDRPGSRDVAEFIGRATLVPAIDAGTHVIIGIGGVDRRVTAVATRGPSNKPFASALAVLRPESLALTAGDATGAWPGTVIEKRFTGTAMTYRVMLADNVVVEVATGDRSVTEGERLGVTVAREPVAVVETMRGTR
ncbi:MAG: ABC transporter ATP-binding protein [Gemmatimonadaceae bacterium]